MYRIWKWVSNASQIVYIDGVGVHVTYVSQIDSYMNILDSIGE
jgi:hypothetical protein